MGNSWSGIAKGYQPVPYRHGPGIKGSDVDTFKRRQRIQQVLTLRRKPATVGRGTDDQKVKPIQAGGIYLTYREHRTADRLADRQRDLGRVPIP